MIKLKDILFEESNEDKYRLVIVYHYDPDDLSDLDVPKRWEPEAKKYLRNIIWLKWMVRMLIKKMV